MCSSDLGLDVIDRLIAESGAAETKDRRRIAREKREAEQAAAHAAAEALAAQARREAHWLETQRERISAALERAHRYLDEFVARLNRERPVYAATYSVIGVRQFSGLKWEGGIVEVRKREVAAETWHYERVSLAFSLASENKLRVTRDRASSERLRKALLDRHIEFTAYDDRGARGEAGWKTFVLSCKVLAGLQLVGDFDRGEIQLHTRNIEEFGELQYILQPEDLDSDSLRELTDRILGQPRN